VVGPGGTSAAVAGLAPSATTANAAAANNFGIFDAFKVLLLILCPFEQRREVTPQACSVVSGAGRSRPGDQASAGRSAVGGHPPLSCADPFAAQRLAAEQPRSERGGPAGFQTVGTINTSHMAVLSSSAQPSGSRLLVPDVRSARYLLDLTVGVAVRHGLRQPKSELTPSVSAHLVRT
jgi:hypothetical protein